MKRLNPRDYETGEDIQPKSKEKMKSGKKVKKMKPKQ